MSHHEDKNSNAFLFVVLAGLLGAGIALLLAPRSGRETRERLKSKANDVSDQAQENYAHIKDQAQDTMVKANGMKDRVASAIKTRGNQVKQDVIDAVDEAKPAGRRKSPIVSNWDEEV